MIGRRTFLAGASAATAIAALSPVHAAGNADAALRATLDDLAKLDTPAAKLRKLRGISANGLSPGALLDLEADLGVDTVKQAEMFAAIRAAYNIPRDENLKLRDYPTLSHVIRFVYDKRPALTAIPPEQNIAEVVQADRERTAAALRAAQVSMSKDRRWAAPHYWAAFTLQGEWK